MTQPAPAQVERTRIQVPFRKDRRALLHLVAQREGRTLPNLCTMILERTIVETVKAYADRDPELAVEIEKHGIDLYEPALVPKTLEELDS